MPGTLVHRLTALSVSSLAVLAITAVPAMARPIQDPVPIGSHQFFVGLVNHHAVRSTIHVLCAGPESTGHPQRGQKVEVVMVVPASLTALGYTGSRAHRIAAWLIWPSAVARSPVRVAVFTSYFVAVPIPVRIRVPCEGRGRMVFVPAPGSRSARPAVVGVTFRSNGV